VDDQLTWFLIGVLLTLLVVAIGMLVL